MRRYRLLTEVDTAAFCQKVTKALADGWELYGSPAYAHDPVSGQMRCAQAVIRDETGEDAPETQGKA
ncbi:DUF1737 domain-containing protein [Rhodovulum adriaticum]|uniref:DUF1737 domain-containing protein n=1 Tax=Rhodovulum adriaticum TaxID=35804 RepID=A0A4R2NMD7_RHOAD|nr:DUF1737 domain-containing protein [Rhodovulum adriaticum]MBK1636731.1 hypothetical protein [Rhodovulum adriaticum]TCP22777.1 hypothetical protein EV656_10576 [Rhodovulum adriaticum]